MQVIKTLSDENIDFIEISGGNYEAPAMLEGVKDSTKKREAYFLAYATQARQVSKAPLVVTGGFRSQKAMEDALEDGGVDFVGLAKPFAIQPDLPNRIFSGSYQTLDLPPIRTDIKKIDAKLASILEMGWYMKQMQRISQGKSPNSKLSAWRVLFSILWENGKNGLRKERA
ncbi:MAG: hypothetical protein Q4A84_06100 [Neisseria sp.]|uniref:hypothetical protein n=1 Tax=Neisseria sp. TaxID=192066 RepID=UPI0026DADCFD|nr:hypothetical protein [Neisseria sp.]MDO4641258.1 hypothetical protein [Neisseria sp.]